MRSQQTDDDLINQSIIEAPHAPDRRKLGRHWPAPPATGLLPPGPQLCHQHALPRRRAPLPPPLPPLPLLLPLLLPRRSSRGGGEVGVSPFKDGEESAIAEVESLGQRD